MKLKTDRRSVLKAGLGGLITVPVIGGLAGCSKEAEIVNLGKETLGERITVISGAPGNVVALNTGDGTLLVDSGSEALGASVKASLEGSLVHTLINTHYHRDQTGGNAIFGEDGATIHSHTITKQWLSAKIYDRVADIGIEPDVSNNEPSGELWIPPIPEVGRPTEVFRVKKELSAGNESIEMGYLLEAHTRGDIYVFFRDSNVLAVGDVVSPVRDPEVDWYTGAWLGGRVDAMDDLLELANDDTLVVPAYGPVMSKAEMQAERDLMMVLYERCTFMTTKGHNAQDMMESGLLDEIERKFENPYKFFYDVARSNWAHYTNFGGATV